MTKVLLVENSSNSKTGNIPVSYVESSTCPSSCALRSNGCYAKNGPTGYHWGRLDRGETGSDWSGFISKIRQLWHGQPWRYGVCGDLPGKSEVVDGVQLAQLVAANRGKKGWAYSHKPVLMGRYAKANRNAILAANQDGFTINLSANNLHHADTLASLGIAPVVAIVPSNTSRNTHTPAGRRVVLCPATTRDRVTCARCGICQRTSREYVVGFPAHGIQVKKADAIARD
jgi:hypothetical protein